ncbi:flavin reductase [Pedobacter sp. JY14-1]|uniref:flavin reductase family protein n=1 Tax=Pedobacter sp. JY14-1 TaxID=3034151 RepID=UPI0023E1A544|nr:flavin reductase [Pedobacter sp. JY14-1]
MIIINHERCSQLDKQYRINLINSLVGYRSLNLLGTQCTDGITNLCIVSSVFHMGSNPALLGLVMRPARAHNDTLRNIVSSGQYTLNNVLPDWYKQAHQTSAAYPSGISEFAICGFTEQYIDGFKAPFVAESSVRIGLDLVEVLDIAVNGTSIVIGEVTQILTADDVITSDGTLNHVVAGTLTVAGLDSYYRTAFLERLPYAKPDHVSDGSPRKK